MNKATSILLLIFASGLLCAYIPWHYGPDHFPAPYNKIERPPNRKRVELGRQLFYDPILSKDSSISCASCHSPFNAFAHTDHDLSHGIHDSIGTRNAPALFNLAWHKLFMWDGAANHLEVQALAPITHPGEMADNIQHITQKLKASYFYQNEFSAIYKDGNITGERILKCLSAFQLTLISANAKYDSVKLGTSRFTPQESKGYELFKSNCNTCHKEPLFSTFEFANNGLSVDTTLNDIGRYNVSKDASDSLLFKIPTLRNLKYTFPYMHDGRFDKLRQVLNHYSHGVMNSPTLDPRLKDKLNLSSKEKTDLIAFLLTLNDQKFVFEREHSFPKKRAKE